MKFGVREICNVVFRAKDNVQIGTQLFKKGQPVLYIDTATTSTIEGAATTVYAQGGRGNTRLLAWEGEKTLTFTVEDALLSSLGFSVLSGAGLIKKFGKGGVDNKDAKVHVHTTTYATTDAEGVIKLGDSADKLYPAFADICPTAPLFVIGADEDGSLDGIMYNATFDNPTKPTKLTITTDGEAPAANVKVFIDFYKAVVGTDTEELQIDADNFAGYYYVEADTLFRMSNGTDYPANITIPKVKIQSNFTFTMAASGDPSTFTFTMDAMPDYTYFNTNKKVLCVIQIINPDTATTNWETVMPHGIDFKDNETDKDYKMNDSVSDGSYTP